MAKPTNYERVKLVLDKLYKKASKNHSKSIDSDVTKRLDALGIEYRSLSSKNRTPVDYSDPITHIAYAFRCLACHGDLVYRSLKSAKKIVGPAFSKQKVKISCIGGGPAADALGIVKFAERQGYGHAKLKFWFLDRETAWKPVRDALFNTFDTVDVSRGFTELDLANGKPWIADWAFAKADIFTFSFCLSEVWSFDDDGSVSKFLDRLISSAHEGALFVYTDNGGPNFMPKADKCFDERADTKLVYSEDDDWMLIGPEEQQSAVDLYVSKFKQSTKMTGNVNRRIWKKL